MLAQVCATLDCAPVQHLGKVLVLWRPNPERRKKAPKAAEAAKPARKRPAKRTPVDPVRERRRAARTEEAAPRGDQARRRRRTV
jgi:RNA-binding protein